MRAAARRSTRGGSADRSLVLPGQVAELDGLPLQLPQQLRHPRHDQQEQCGAADHDGLSVGDLPGVQLDRQDGRRDQRDGGQQDQHPAAEPGRPRTAGPADLAGAGVQRRYTEQHERHQKYHVGPRDTGRNDSR